MKGEVNDVKKRLDTSTGKLRLETLLSLGKNKSLPALERETYLEEGLQLARQLETPDLEYWCTYYLGQLYCHGGEAEKAKKHCTAAKALANEQSNETKVAYSHLLLSKFHNLIENNFTRALHLSLIHI